MATIEDLSPRINEAYLIDIRNGRFDTFGDWKIRIREARDLANGQFKVTSPGLTTTIEKPYVMNIAEAMPRDVSRLVSESTPTIRAYPHDDSTKAQNEAFVREVIADTYGEMNKINLLTPQWAMDMVIAGAAFAVAWVDSSSDYPRFTRVDPASCYPDVVNGVLQNLLTVQRMKLRQADLLWPDARLAERASTSKAKVSDEVEIWDYYSSDEVIKAVALMDTKGGILSDSNVTIVQRFKPGTDCPPAAIAMLPSHDGGFRGMLDQIGGSLEAKNRAVKYMIEYAHQQVFAPFEAKGIINPDDEPGPTTIYQHDPSVDGSRLGRVNPAGAAPQLFALLQLVDGEQRGALAYPAARQGEVSQSVASGSFISASQGQLSSLVRGIQNALAEMRKELTEICFQLDEKHKNFEKPLLRSIEKKNTYSPLKDIKGRYMVQVVYGAGAGIDRLNADVRVLQYKGAGLISDETAREQIDFVKDASGEGDKIEQEATAKAILQRFLADPNSDMESLIEIYLAQSEGASLVEALKKIKERMAAKKMAEQMPQQQPAEMGMLNNMAQPQEPGAEQQGLAAGAIPSQLPQELQFAPPPLEQVVVRNQ